MIHVPQLVASMSPPNPIEPPVPVVAPVPVRMTTFLKPRFGITVQRNTLCVAVSARPPSEAPRPVLTPGHG